MRLLSVVIPAKDEQAFLPELLLDLAWQSVHPDEVIVVDDDSRTPTDYSTYYPFPGFRQVRGQGIGAWAAKNVGAQVAKYDLLFIDADVRLPIETIAHVKQAAESHLVVTAHNTEFWGPALHPYAWAGFTYFNRDLFFQLGGWPEAYVEDWPMTQKLEQLGVRIHVLDITVGLQRYTQDVFQKAISMWFYGGLRRP